MFIDPLIDNWIVQQLFVREALFPPLLRIQTFVQPTLKGKATGLLSRHTNLPSSRSKAQPNTIRRMTYCFVIVNCLPDVWPALQ